MTNGYNETIVVMYVVVWRPGNG